MTETKTLISDWLNDPFKLSAQEQQQVAELLEKHPHFVPARWMLEADSINSSGFSKEILNENQLFSGNWLQFYAGVQQAKSERKTAPLELNIVDEDKSTATEKLQHERTIKTDEANLIQPLFVDNYFQHQGISVSEDIPAELDKVNEEEELNDEKSLMVMMGFDEWLLFLKRKNEAKRSDEEDKAMLRSMWQREKLAAAMGEEDDNIPEAVFEMAINSIDRQDIMVSESLAEIHVKQGHHQKAIEIYRKLSLQNPEKKTYFAAKINHLNKENLS